MPARIRLAIILLSTVYFVCGEPYRKIASVLRSLSVLRIQQRRCSGTLRNFSFVAQMSVLFNDARFNARARPRARLSTGLWLSVVAHATLAGVLAVVPTRASEKPRPRSIPVFLMPSTETVKLRSPSRRHAFRCRYGPRAEAVIAKVPEPVAAKPDRHKPVRRPGGALPAKVPALHGLSRPKRPNGHRRPASSGGRPVRKQARPPPRSRLAASTAVTASRGTASRRCRRDRRIRGDALAARTPATAAVATGGSEPVRRHVARNRPGSAAATTGGVEARRPAARRSSGAETGDVQTSGLMPASAPVQAAAAPEPIDRPVEIVFKPTPEMDEARRPHPGP